VFGVRCNSRWRQKDVAQVDVAEDDNVIEASRQIDPISLSACPFCQGGRGAIG